MIAAFIAALKPEIDHLWTLWKDLTQLFVDVEDYDGITYLHLYVWPLRLGSGRLTSLPNSVGVYFANIV